MCLERRYFLGPSKCFDPDKIGMWLWCQYTGATGPPAELVDPVDTVVAEQFLGIGPVAAVPAEAEFCPEI